VEQKYFYLLLLANYVYFIHDKCQESDTWDSKRLKHHLWSLNTGHKKSGL